CVVVASQSDGRGDNARADRPRIPDGTSISLQDPLSYSHARASPAGSSFPAGGSLPGYVPVPPTAMARSESGRNAIAPTYPGPSAMTSGAQVPVPSAPSEYFQMTGCRGQLSSWSTEVPSAHADPPANPNPCRAKATVSKSTVAGVA